MGNGLQAVQPVKCLAILILACCSGGAFGQSLPSAKEVLQKSDPELLRALQKRFSQIDDIEGLEDCANKCSFISIYTPRAIWACTVTRNPMKLRCRTRHQ